MKLKTVSLNVVHVPNITITDFSGNDHKNASLPESDQIKVELRRATSTELVEYQKSYMTIEKDGTQRHHAQIDVDYVISKHVKRVINLEHETGMIDTAEKLIACAENDELVDLIKLDCYNVIMGRTAANMNKIVGSSPEHTANTEPLSSGESRASESAISSIS